MKIFTLFLVLLSLNSFAQNQSTPSSTSPSSANTSPKKTESPTPQNIEASQAPSPKKDMLTQYLETGKTSGLNQDISTPNNYDPKFPSVWGPFFFLLLVGIILYYGVKYIRKRMFNEKVKNNPVDFIRTIASVPITNTASIAVIEIAEKYFLFGLTSHNMQMLEEITDKELIYKIKNIPLNAPTSKSFREVISSFFVSNERKKIDPTISKNQLSDFIKKQKDRLDNMK